MSAILSAFRRSSCPCWGFGQGYRRKRRGIHTLADLQRVSAMSLPLERHNAAFEPRGNSKAKPQVLVISGPTAVGKSALALELAEQLGGEIISCDSVQVYRGLDVGSAKTPLSERRGIPHHLLNVKEPTEEYTAGDFYRDARAATEDVLSRGKLPVVVGGTGLYLRWFIHGTPDTPKPSPELAAEIEAKIASFQQRENGWQEAVAHLAEVGDSRTGSELAPNDWYRLQRALEIVLASGRPKSDFQLNFVKAQHKAPPKRAKRKRLADGPNGVLSGPAESPGVLAQDHNRIGNPNPFTESPPAHIGSISEDLSVQPDIVRMLDSATVQSNLQTSPAPIFEPSPNQAPEPSSNHTPEPSSNRIPETQTPEPSHQSSEIKTLATFPDQIAESQPPEPFHQSTEEKTLGPPPNQTPEIQTPSTSGQELDYDFRCYFLFGPRKELYRKIDERCEQMVIGGLLEEAARLLDKAIKADTCMPSRAIGYRQALEYLEECRGGVEGAQGRERFLKFLDDFQQASRKYAKRQLTWFRSEGSFLWLDATRSTAELADRISTDLQTENSSLDAQKGLIPDSWLSKEQEREMRAYRSERRIFQDDAAIAGVLARVEETQGKPRLETTVYKRAGLESPLVGSQV